ncbi:putative integral membrane protein [Phaeoacremonium minimum UCRPA7]|uniref:Putative integral membrane protein n=1 Tax=Phaeoacremonium minimum (strain UCR-PA7) TaxID=1286976 RepID=R8BNL1_PHAM7|nr:putative integral membrane protein [Phaeoacremonium minimum UCRPA7]EOO00993.1 putative integral membrane protein [Phaeoacremonium minimum UCRPA7]
MEGIKGYDPNNLQPWTVEVVVSMTVLAVISVGLRLLSRHLKAQQLWWDDWMIIFSLAWNLVVVGFIFAMYGAGMGIHADKVPLDQIVLMAKFLLVAEILYAWNLCWTKISLLLMYYRIFRFPFFKRMAYAIGAFIIAWGITITFLFIFICVPVQKLWYTDLPGHCINQVGTWIANAASTIVTDLAILVLPIPQVWKLQLRKPEKIALTFAFCLGFFVVFASAYRFSVLFSYSNADPTYTLAPTVGWTSIEMSAGIVSACLPTLRPVLLLFGRTLGVKGSIFRSGAASAAFSKNHGQSASRGTRSTGDRTDAELVNSKKGKSGAFYRLDDDNLSGETTADGLPVDAKLRPDHGYGYTVTSKPGKGEGDSLSGDEIPLQGIRVHTDFKHSTS